MQGSDIALANESATQVYNFEQWKVFFKSVLYPLNYYDYESKKIKPSFTATLL